MEEEEEEVEEEEVEVGLSEDTAELFEVTRTNPNMRTLEECANLLRRGGVGIIPTDTKYSFVADLNNKDAIQNLYTIKDIDSNKPLSILCRGFRDIDTYTLGFPPATRPGMTDPFKLPGSAFQDRIPSSYPHQNRYQKYVF